MRVRLQLQELKILSLVLKSLTIFGLAAAMPLSSTVAGGNMDGQGLAGLIMVMHWPREDMELEETGALERKKRLFALRFVLDQPRSRRGM
ncbi:Os03g0367650 [Oryza sativa Japonica Group]|uniref:Os03g0367650 protein n=1 Tax=Oryza sativa subsp. japonica TaxID=39947 RepID=A0A0P0VYN9_ORYSJ|nr:Os03g0367650 [Oryza sativa Japonica Group]